MVCFAICEDEAYFAGGLEKMLARYLKDRNLEGEILSFASGEELLRSGRRPDVALMDIKLPGKSGMEIVDLLQRAGKGCQAIFITAYREYVFRAFELDAVHYLLKPVRRETLYLALDRAVNRMEREEEKMLLLEKGSRMLRIRFREIRYCEVFDHEVVIDTDAGSFRTSRTLDALERELDERFFRCHRSYLVNMDRVMEKGAGTAVVAGGGRVLVSRRREQEFRRRLLQSCRKREDG